MILYHEIMNEDLKELIVVAGMVEAEIIKGKLESNDIPVMLKYEAVGNLFGITMNGLGKVKVMVNARHLDESRELIEEDGSDEAEIIE